MSSWVLGAVLMAVAGVLVGVALSQGLLELSPREPGAGWAPAWALSASAWVSWDWERATLGPLSWEFRAPVLLVWLHNPTGKWAQVALLAEYPPQAAPPLPLGSLGATESQLLSLLTTWDARILHARGNATLATTPTPTQTLPPGTRVALLSPGATALLEIPLHWGAPEKLHLCTPTDCTQLPLTPQTTPPNPPQPQPWTPIKNPDEVTTVFKYVERVYIVVDGHGGPQGMLVPHPNAIDANIVVDEDAPGPCDPPGTTYRYAAMGSTILDPPPVRATCESTGVRWASFGEFTLPVAEKTEYSNGTIVYRPLTSNVTWGAVYWPDPATSPTGDAGLLLDTTLTQGSLTWVVGTPAFTYAEDNVIRPPTGTPAATLKSIPNLAAQGLYTCMSREYTLVVEIEILKDVYENGRLKAKNQPATLGELVDAWAGRSGATPYLHLQSLAYASSFFHTGKTATWVRHHNLTQVAITYQTSPGTTPTPAYTGGGGEATPPPPGIDAWVTRFNATGNTNDPASIPLPRDATILRIALTYAIEAPRPPDAWQPKAVPTLPTSVWGGENCPYTYIATAGPGGTTIEAMGVRPEYQGYSPLPPPIYLAAILALITE